MANMDKFDYNATTFVLRHCERTLPNMSNKDIDYERTIKNYNLAPNRGREYLKNRLKEVYIYGGKNASRKTVYSVGWVLTAPKGMKEEDTRHFFEVSKQFLDSRYGEKNCLGSYVHMDERTPHMHYIFTPVVWDAKHEREKLCASDIMKKKELYSFHSDLQNHLYKNGINTRIFEGHTKERGFINKPIEQYKADKLKERTKEICFEF